MQIIEVEAGDARYAQMLGRFPSTARYIADPADDGDYHFFAAVMDDGRIVGGAVIDVGPMEFGPFKDVTIGFLEDIEVDATCRRRGIGTALLQAVLAYAWRRGAQHVRWTVDWANAAGLGFYRHAGAAILPEGDSPEQAEPYYTCAVARPTHVTTSDHHAPDPPQAFAGG